MKKYTIKIKPNLRFTPRRILPVILILSFFLFSNANAQVLKDLSDRLEQKVKDRANRKVDKAMDKGLDKVEDGIDGNTKKKTSPKGSSKTEPSGNEDQNSKNSNSKSTSKSNNSFKVDTKFDFVPGEKIVLIEDFSKDNIGDFPDKWNTNGSGEIVTTNKAEGKYLETKKAVILYPEWLKSLPENFTLEFDLMCSDIFSYNSQYFYVGFTTVKDISKNWSEFDQNGNGSDKSDVVQIGFHPASTDLIKGLSFFKTAHNATRALRNDIEQDQFTIYSNKSKAHVSIWRQKQRVRVYLNDKKIWDIPRAIDASAKMNSVFFRNDGTDREPDAYYFSNVKIAVGQADTRNKLITEGKFSTSGILFNVNSDKIKAESYGAIKDIANVLNENADVKVKIIGHTDNDGDDAKNMELSKKRAAAVKAMLSKEFNIDASRIETDGKGESQPAVANDSPENKAQNRRVEFIKQ